MAGGMDPKMLMSLGAMVAMRYLDFEDKMTLNIVVGVYIFEQIIIFSVYAWMRLQIMNTPGLDGDCIKVVAPDLPLGMKNPEPDKEMSSREYDMFKWNEQFKQAAMGAVICCVIYYKWNSPTVLFLQGVMSPFTAFQHPLVSIYLLGKSAEGDLKRPFPAPPGMFDELKKAADAAKNPDGHAAMTSQQKKDKKISDKEAFVNKKRAEIQRASAEKVD